MSKQKATDEWLMLAQVGRRVERVSNTVRRWIMAGKFGSVGDGTGGDPVKRVPYKANTGVTGFTYYVRESAVEAFLTQRRKHRESLRGNRQSA